MINGEARVPAAQRVKRLVNAARKLRPGEAASLFRLVGLVLALPVLHRLLSLPSLMGLLDTKRRGEPRGDPERRLQLVRGLLAQRIGLLQPKCFYQSLLLFNDLRRLGHDVTVRFGISEKQSALEGHSWVELGDEPFGEARDPRPEFKVVYSYPPLSDGAEPGEAGTPAPHDR